ncbi:hypothetical protein R1flu_002529 [Riccia fluitans]|uniref:Uncharacterized protein n=1 Tax=Riccia fluitans TaxID=41844 RepID=A0ABD1YA76_9MARC
MLTAGMQKPTVVDSQPVGVQSALPAARVQLAHIGSSDTDDMPPLEPDVEEGVDSRGNPHSPVVMDLQVVEATADEHAGSRSRVRAPKIIPDKHISTLWHLELAAESQQGKSLKMLRQV